jgi:uncharacterized phage protein (TIGR01671 family)
MGLFLFLIIEPSEVLMKERDIKFRVWDLQNQKMHYYDELSLDWKKYINNENYKLMQFTGILDKTGTEIYEGDVLNSKFDKDFLLDVRWKAEGKILSLVYWDLAGFRLRTMGKGEARFFRMVDLLEDESEIIGNIYSNIALEALFYDD